MPIFIVEVEGDDDVANEPREFTGRLWVSTEKFVWDHFQPDDMVHEIIAAGMAHLTPTIIDELGIGSEPPVKGLD